MNSQRVSIIIEWENVLTAEMDRCRAMMRELRRQIDELAESNALGWLSFPIEVAAVFDRNRIGEAVVEKEMAEVFPPRHSTVQTVLWPSSGLRYYELKNFGAQRARGDILLFLDSDVIPEAGWLQNLLGAFGNSEVEVAGGVAHVEPSDFLSKTFALTSFYPLRTDAAALAPARYFYANNVAFRRETFARFPFPEVKAADRGGCVMLADALREQSVAIYRHCGAWVKHPAPTGLRHFFVRGLAHGRDNWLRTGSDRGKPRLISETRKILKDGVRALGSIARNRKKVKLSLAQTPFAAGVVVGYGQARLLGMILTRISPTFMQKHFRI